MSLATLAHFLMRAQSAERVILNQPDAVSQESMSISEKLDLALAIPQVVKSAGRAAEVYRYLFVFEVFLRELVREVLSESDPEEWWEKKVPTQVKEDVAKSKETDEMKAWMALGIRDRLALTTYPQVLSIIDHCWKTHFEVVIRDKALLQEARHLTHMRNAICHMSEVPEEEINRIKQVMRDWFRVVEP